ncbi:efflux RND transporter permease subunit [Acidipila sp. EB88]|uniref:efflux RND transporter permease subunit n=1 Tax=Acidipila sp. EB88 TaxID=2305226 RepID=UPI000F5E4DC7|nr:efflux RND transporter permease subunit [Acidipila sp. EB88]RRA50396.1 efflux RND transporter permease subunit [Acidipila sp. EB88]
MPTFALRYPFFIIMLCLMVLVVGVVNVTTMPVDLFPKIDIPVVVVATFYSGMPPQQIEADITDTFERFFTLGANIDHIESRSLTGVSLVKIYFNPGTDGNAALSNISNLAMADLRRLPPGTLPPVVLGMTASSEPVCLVTLKGKGLNQTQLKDLAQFQVRNQIANVQGASVPQPFGGRYRQIQVYVDPLKLEAHNMSLMDVVDGVNQSNLILPAGDVRIGTKDYNIYANSQMPNAEEMNSMPLKSEGNASVLVGDIGHAEDSGALQTNIVRIDGQHSVYVPVLKQGGKSNTIQIVNGMRAAIKHLVDIPDSLKTAVVFDQSKFVKTAIHNLLKEAGIGLFLTSIMILVFLGNPRATIAVLLSIPLSALTCLLLISGMGGTINTMLLGGLALAFSRLIDDSVVVLENIFRFMEEGKEPEEAAREGGIEVALPVLAATSTTSIVFFPVFLLSGVSKYIFTDLALAVVFSIFASYLFSMTVVPLFCAKFIRIHKDDNAEKKPNIFKRFVVWFNGEFQQMLAAYETLAYRVLRHPGWTTAVLLGSIALILLALSPFVGRSYFPRTDPGQFVVNVKMPSGTRIEVSDQYVARIENIIRQVIAPKDLDMIVSNIGITPDLSAIYTPNASMDTGFIQVSFKEGQTVGSYAYIDRVRARLASEMPEVGTYFQAGGLIDSVVNQGLPAPLDIQISSNNQDTAFATAKQLANQLRSLSTVSQVYIPQDLKYPGLELDIDRQRASLIGLSPKNVVDNVITALTSNGVIAPSYWIDPETGNNYMLTVQYSTKQIGTMNMEELQDIPLRGVGSSAYTPLRSVVFTRKIDTPTEVDHYQLRRVIDVYVQPKTEALNLISKQVNQTIAVAHTIKGTRITVHGAVQSMNNSFERFGLGLLLSVALVYLILMAQFKSFIEPFIILMAIPPGLAGVVMILLFTGATLNVMSLMGVIMMTGIVVSNSILIVEFSGVLRGQGNNMVDAVVQACKIRLRPILMTSLATLLGMIPMALGLEAGSEQYAPLARAIIGGLALSVAVTVFLVPAVYLLVHGTIERRGTANPQESA